MKKIITISMLVFTLIFSNILIVSAHTRNQEYMNGWNNYVATMNGGNVNVRDYRTFEVIGSFRSGKQIYLYSSDEDIYRDGYNWCLVYGQRVKDGKYIYGYMRSDYINYWVNNPNISIEDFM